MKLFNAGLLVAAMLAAASAQAVTTYNFSYAATGGTLTGKLTGTLQADNNTVLVSSIVDFARWNNVPGPSLPFVNSDSLYPTVVPGLVTVDGSAMDILACTDALCMDGFLFDTTGAFGPPAYASSPPFGRLFEPYVQASWSLSAVPEPASWALMITGFGLVGGTLRRRQVAATA